MVEGLALRPGGLHPPTPPGAAAVGWSSPLGDSQGFRHCCATEACSSSARTRVPPTPGGFTLLSMRGRRRLNRASGEASHCAHGDMLRSQSEMDHFYFEMEPLSIRFLRTLKELLKFVLFSYTVLLGALLLAGWTTYFMVAK
ncbi:hypothetical protein GN956_G10089 [Arapaima gigas]